MGSTPDSNRGAHEVSLRWRRSGGTRAWDQGHRCGLVAAAWNFLLRWLWVLVAGCGGLLMWVVGVLVSGWWGFDFGLLGFWFRTHSREGRWLLGFTMVFSSCLGILVGAAALAAASAAAAALAAAQISWGRYMKVILVMLWVGFVDLCVAWPTICWNFFFFLIELCSDTKFDVGQARYSNMKERAKNTTRSQHLGLAGISTKP